MMARWVFLVVLALVQGLSRALASVEEVTLSTSVRKIFFIQGSKARLLLCQWKCLTHAGTGSGSRGAGVPEAGQPLLQHLRTHHEGAPTPPLCVITPDKGSFSSV